MDAILSSLTPSLESIAPIMLPFERTMVGLFFDYVPFELWGPSANAYVMPILRALYDSPLAPLVRGLIPILVQAMAPIMPFETTPEGEYVHVLEGMAEHGLL